MSTSFVNDASDPTSTGVPGDLTSGMVRQIHLACEQFENQWEPGEYSHIEDLLKEFLPRDRPLALYWLLQVEVEKQGAEGKLLQTDDLASRFKEYEKIISCVLEEVQDVDANENATTHSWSARFNLFRKLSLPFPKVGKRVDRFLIRGVLGTGGFGKVFRAYDPQLEREVAIKIPRFSTWRNSLDCQHRLNEARAAAIVTHPNICPIYEVGVEQQRPYIVMACIDGESLSKVIAERGISDESSIILLTLQIALAMEEAHRHGIIHRDLKPANILMDHRGNPILTDFGLAARTVADNEDEEHIQPHGGTSYYMPPEQVRGEVTGPASDIYSLGTTFYELLAGRRPFVGNKTEVRKQILEAVPLPPSHYRPEISPCADAICLKALEKNPVDRFASMMEMADCLREVLKASDPDELYAHVEKFRISESASDSASHQFVKKNTAAVNWRASPWVLLIGILLIIATILTGRSMFFSDPTAPVTERKKSAPQSADQLAAQWLVSVGATFDIRINENNLTITRSAEIPKEPFQIFHIDLSHHRGLRNQHLAKLKDLISLRSLLLPDTQITDEALTHLRGLTELELLWMDRTGVTDAGLSHLWNLKKLESLSLNGTQIKGDGLRSISGHTVLKRLSLKQTQVDNQGIRSLGEFPFLTHVWLDGTRVGDEGLEVFKHLPDLLEVSLNRTDVQGPGLRHLTALPKLQLLGLNSTDLHDQGLGELGVFPALTHLFANSTELGNEGLCSLVKAAPHLIRLSIGRTHVTGSGAECLNHLPKLEMLDLDGIPISRKAMETLLTLPSLKALSLRSSPIGKRHVPVLAKMTNLEYLDLSNTKISPDVRSFLASELSDCEVR